MQGFLRVANLLAVLTFFSVTSSVTAESGPQSGGRPAQPWFDQSGLKVGDPFPEVSVFDASGKPFNTRSLKGQYTVLVSGCLT